MPRRIAQSDASSNVPSRGRAFAYVLPCTGEDILKIGFSRDPLERLRTLHPRYFDFFDCQRGLLIQTDHVRDARGLERELASTVFDHRAPSPLVVPRFAAGHTEWFRGAYVQVAAAADALSYRLGHPLHAPLRTWLSQRLQQDAEKLFEWSLYLLDAIQIQRPLDPEPARPLERKLVDRLDEYAFADMPVDALIPADVRDWYRSARPRF